MSRAAAPAGDQVRVSVLVAVPPAAAFEIFTQEIDRWWRRGPRLRASRTQRGIICIEPRVGGRLFESIESGAGEHVVQTGTVTAWEPPSRLCFDWQGVNFAPGEKTNVEVGFAPSPSGTLLTVTHRGWSGLRADHPVRHGREPAAFIRMMGMWWGDLMTSLRELAAGPHAARYAATQRPHSRS
jgi:uncharacterized protein YndB with AHSA1/START domain